MRKINLIELARIIKEHKNEEINITYLSNSMVKRNTIKNYSDVISGVLDRNYGFITAIVNGNVKIGGTYGGRIFNQLKKKGINKEYDLEARRYGTEIVGHEISEHKGIAYLRIYYQPKNLMVSFTNGVANVPSEYVTKNNLYKPYPSEVKKQTEIGLYGGEQVLMHEVRLDSIINITIDGISYEVNDFLTAFGTSMVKETKPIIDALIGMLESNNNASDCEKIIDIVLKYEKLQSLL